MRRLLLAGLPRCAVAALLRPFAPPAGRLALSSKACCRQLRAFPQCCECRGAGPRRRRGVTRELGLAFEPPSCSYEAPWSKHAARRSGGRCDEPGSVRLPAVTRLVAKLGVQSARCVAAEALPPPAMEVAAAPPVVAGARIAVQDSIVLRLEEQELFAALLGTVQHFGLATQLRVAGGWVRDKLLGKDSNDIDIALDDTLGRDFAEKVNQYLQHQGVETHKVGVVRSNPDQSKHLETATMRIHGVWIDLVNLRAETYADDSRIPSMEFGSPLDDALRRDLTINSLFYNINTGNVEDLTQKGIQDLQDGRIRTPMPPRSTFLDDPLRVLRAICFGARFGFQLDEKLKQAAQLPEVREALAFKISRGRIGKEIDLMLRGKNPAAAMFHLADLGLFESVFAIPGAQRFTPQYGRQCSVMLSEVAHVLEIWPPCSSLEARSESVAWPDERMQCLLAGLFLPLRHTQTADKKGKMIPVSVTSIREALKAKTKDADVVSALHSKAEEFQSVSQLLLLPPQESLPDIATCSISATQHEASQRIAAGLAVRKLGKIWRSALLLSTLLNHPAAASVDTGSEYEKATLSDQVLSNCSDGHLAKRARTHEYADLCRMVEKKIEAFGLERAWEIKPLLDGTAIIRLLDLRHAGPKVKIWTQKQVEWQLSHLDGSPEDCQRWLLDEYATGAAVQPLPKR
eukprot:SM000076S21792  [mRNA]  locus=s76:203603:208691:- [translate_table: standard]